jgi:hypothetical protein
MIKTVRQMCDRTAQMSKPPRFTCPKLALLRFEQASAVFSVKKANERNADVSKTMAGFSRLYR